MIELIHDALESAKQYYSSSSVAIEFIDNNLCKIVKMLLSLSAEDLKTATYRVNVERSIRIALQLVNQDLRKKAHKFTVNCSTIEALVPIFDYKEAYYEVNPPSRMDKILSFQRIKGYYQLSIYLSARCSTSLFPDWQFIHRVLVSSYQCITSLRDNDERKDYLYKSRKESAEITRAVMKHMITLKLEALENVEVKKLSAVVLDLLTLSQEHAYADSKSMPEYISFCQDFIIKLLSVESPEHNQYGAELLHTLFRLVQATGPVNDAVTVKGAGLITCDGLYTLESPSKDQDGFLIPSASIKYVRKVKATGEKFVLFLDSTMDVKRTWSLCEEFSVESGVLELADFYTNVPERIQNNPPLSGWIVANEDGRSPAPTIAFQETTIPIRDEYTNLLEGVARWFIEKNVVKLVLGIDNDSFSHSFMMNTVDALMNGRDFVSNEMLKQLGSILPVSRPELTEDMRSSIKLTAIDVAKRSVASAEEWKEDTSKHQAALQSVNRALDFLADLEMATRRDCNTEGLESSNIHQDKSSETNTMKVPAVPPPAPSESPIATDSSTSASLEEHDISCTEVHSMPSLEVHQRRQLLTGRSMRAGLVPFRKSTRGKF